MPTKSNDTIATDSNLDPDHVVIGLTRQTKRFLENLAFVRTWKQYEVLELIIQGIELADVSITWLEEFRDDLDLKV